MGLEPIQIAPHAPQTCAATTRSTRTRTVIHTIFTANKKSNSFHAHVDGKKIAKSAQLNKNSFHAHADGVKKEQTAQSNKKDPFHAQTRMD